MKIVQTRYEFGHDYTISNCEFGKYMKCYILEDIDRHLEDNPDAKNHGASAIPRGIYQVLITYSNRFKKPLIQLMDVPGFTGIRCHPGNTSADTEGCLLPGSTHGPAWVGNSRATYAMIHHLVEKVLDSGKEVTWEIK